MVYSYIMKESGGISMFDDKLVTWKVMIIMPVLVLGEAMYQLCDFIIGRMLDPLAGTLHEWCLKDKYKRD